jgi:hypothetical protein
MTIEKPTPALMENLITMLCYDDVNGKVLARLIDPVLFDGDYRVIADRTIQFWAKHRQAPKMHTADLVSDILSDQYNRQAAGIRRILHAMHAIHQQINTAYVLDQWRNFTRLQTLKDIIIKSADSLSSQREYGIAEVEAMWSKILRTRDASFHPGIWLNDIDRMLAYIDAREREFDVGIDILDRTNAVPARGSVLLFLGGAASGKSWYLIHCGKRALVQQKKICHITLELSEELTLQRYYQSLFSLPKRGHDGGFPITTLRFDKDRKLTGFGSVEVNPEFHFKSQDIRTELESRVQWMGNKFQNLLIKRFPPKKLTPDLLRSYLDNLEISDGFKPDLLILDYLKEMATDTKEYRHSMDENLAELRGIAVEKNLACVTAQQLSREGSTALMARSSHVAEAWGLIGTADVVLTFSRTDAEARHGLARLHVSKNREDEGNQLILLTQNYRIGQFVLESAPLHLDTYYDQLKQLTEETKETEETDEEETEATDED